MMLGLGLGLNKVPVDDGSTTLNFLSGTLPTYFTFTRASSGTYIDSSGVLRTAATDTPRFDYNPSTGAARGLLIEGSRTNTVTYSGDTSNAAWIKTNMSVGGSTETAPDGTTSVSKCIPSAGAGQHFINQSAITSGTTYTVSVFAKAGGYNFVYFRGMGLGGSGGAQFNLSTKAVHQVNGFSSASVVDVGNGWVRCIATGTATSTTAPWFHVVNAGGSSDGSFTGNGTDGAYLWGMQVEAGAFASSYIPTTTASAVRAADLCSVTDLTALRYNQSEGTMVMEVMPRAISASGTFPSLFEFNDNTSNNRVGAYLSSDSSVHGIDVVGGVSQGDLSFGGTYAPLTAFKMAYAWKENDRAMCFNGGSVVTDGTCSIPTVDRMALGYSAGGGSQGFVWISRITYFPYRVANATLQGLTA